jgi:N-methylhydantoinase A/oxoprolinase/acetone carboxylase beta subunit
MLRGGELTAAAVGEVVSGLAATGRDELGTAAAEVRCSYDLRYRGQAFELTVGGAEEPDPADLRRAFDDLHAERYGYADPRAELELVTVRVAVAEPGGAEPEPGSAAAERVGTRTAWFADGKVEAEVVRGVPEEVAGPAICEFEGSTVVIPPGWSGRRDASSGALIIERRPA